MGFIKIEIPAEGRTLAFSPFHALEGASVEGAEMLGWSPEWGAYTNLAGHPPDTGHGFWLLNPATTQVMVHLGGEVPLDPESAVALAPGLNLIGYPYLGAPTAESLMLDPAALTDAAGAPAAVLLPGQAYWYRHDGPTPQLWLATRPYPNPFTIRPGAPLITSIGPAADGQSIRLTLEGHDAAAEALIVYRVAFDPAQPINAWAWERISDAIPTHGRETVEWQDDSPSPQPGALYLVMGVNPNTPATWSLPPAVGDWRPVTPPEALSPETGNAAASAALARREIHVHGAQGDDRFSGRQARVQGGDGPKRTIRAGLAANPPAAVLHLHAGTYGETMDLRGRDLRVIAHGRVVF